MPVDGARGDLEDNATNFGCNVRRGDCCPNVTRLPVEGVSGGGSADDGLRSLKVDFIDSNFDTGRAIGLYRVTRLLVERTGGGGGVDDGLRSLNFMDPNFDPDRGLTVTRLPVERGGGVEDGRRSLKVDFIDSNLNPGRATGPGPNIIRVPEWDDRGGGAEVGFRSLVCAYKVDFIGSGFDPGRGSDFGPTVTQISADEAGGGGVAESSLRFLDSALEIDLVSSSFAPDRVTGSDCGPTMARMPVEGVGGGTVAEDGLRSLV